MPDPAARTSHRFEGHDGLRFLFIYVALYIPFAVATPYLQKLLACRGFDKGEIGLILGFFECMAVIAPPIWGYLVDRTGTPRLILGLAVFGIAPTFLLFGLASSVWVAIGIALLFGFFYRSVIPLTDGITFRYLKKRHGDYGRIRIGGSTGFILSVLALELVGISKTTSGTMILVAMVVACSIHLISVFFLPDAEGGTTRRAREASPHEAPHLRALLTRPFLCFTFTAFLGRMSMMAYYSFFTLFLAEQFGMKNPGLLWIVGPISEMPVIFFSRRIMDRIGARNLFALGLAGCTVRLIGFAGASQIWMLVPLQLLHSLTFGAFHTASVTYVSKCVPHELQGTAQTTFAALTAGVGGILGSAIGGLVALHYGFPVLYLGAGLLALLALAMLLLTVPAMRTD
jgi:PPP family 3-phenylpropionic acid transporter